MHYITCQKLGPWVSALSFGAILDRD